jgi:acetamidase/formamidase
VHGLHRPAAGHLGFDRDRPAAVTAAPGDELELELADCFDGQLTAAATARDIGGLDLDRANPLTGPVAVEGLEPGDTLVVDILEVAVGPVGWTAVLPGFGLLADDFPDPHLVVSTIGSGTVTFGRIASLPVRSLLGTVGMPPAEAGTHSAIPPRRVGGNLDLRDVRPGARLLLPVEVPGGLLSAGDPHATQGDGEVCGTAVETTARARVRVDVHRGATLPAPQLQLPSEGTAPIGRRHVTTGVGPDLHTCARDATRAAIEALGAIAGLEPADAYVLCSVAGDLRIVEVVNAPTWVVAMSVDLSVLD